MEKKLPGAMLDVGAILSIRLCIYNKSTKGFGVLHC